MCFGNNNSCEWILWAIAIAAILNCICSGNARDNGGCGCGC